MPRQPMVTRNFRVPQSDWDDAMATASAAGESFAEALREFTEWYAHRPRAREPWRPERGVTADELKRETSDRAAGSA